ncbi:MFS transporter [Nitrospirillum sp. BR 11164]|uniref:MFS transporter n=1 Tax=Nitrospirillum sp. BR 11164 TaxID=3104324 RepID=UPI002B002BF0|nr:MFS transporter [Nitrospirillum sp. BR 11164]MEA1647921.1 MFS transporter [Nitrospirillum sp. BR 11164]
MRREWLVLAAVSLSFFFLNAATFASLGVVLYTMVGELHWSFKAAGFSFSLLGIACGLSSVFPTTLMKRIGPRYTMALGGLVLVAAYMLASYTHGLVAFYAAMLLLGLGYSLTGNVPAIYAIACWFPRRSARMIGLYLMIGAFGGVVGPPWPAPSSRSARTGASIGWRWPASPWPSPWSTCSACATAPSRPRRPPVPRARPSVRPRPRGSAGPTAAPSPRRSSWPWPPP